jgi:hypothetical protein
LILAILTNTDSVSIANRYLRYRCRACDQHPSSPADLFKCSQAECQVCLNLSLKFFPLYSKCSLQFHEYSQSRKWITTTLANLEASGDCNYRNIVFGAIEHSCKRKEWGNSPSFEELSARRVSKVEIVLRPNFTVELVIAKGLPSELHLEVYTEPSKHPELGFIPQFAKSVEKTCLPYQDLYAVYVRLPISHCTLQSSTVQTSLTQGLLAVTLYIMVAKSLLSHNYQLV